MFFKNKGAENSKKRNELAIYVSMASETSTSRSQKVAEMFKHK